VIAWRDVSAGRWKRYQATGLDVEALVTLWPERGTWDYSVRLDARGILRAERGGYATVADAQIAAVAMIDALRRLAAEVTP
jgi:hypothetical protein